MNGAPARVTPVPPDLGLAALTGGAAPPERLPVASQPLLAALVRAGARHIYGDTADPAELARVAIGGDGRRAAEVDGNTANQPLVRKALAGLDPGELARWQPPLIAAARAADVPLLPVLYAALCAGIGNGFRRRLGAGAAWDGSLQLHMELCAEPAAARVVARALALAVPGALVKVPFAPHLPQTLLLARDLQADGIPVNLTSTFSARQAVAAALLAGVSRTNIFMGRINQALGATLLGEHVCLEAQRHLLALRRDPGVPTQLIVASMREWRTFVEAAGCDAFTAPCGVLAEFLAQREVAPEAIRSRVDVRDEDRVFIGDAALRVLGAERIARLHRVEPEFTAFLLKLRAAPEFARITGPELAARFRAAGFGDFFYAPSADDWHALRQDKLVPLEGPLTAALALDTHFTLRAHADFEAQQRAIDEKLASHRAADLEEARR